MMPDAFYTDLPSLTDTEIRILLVAYANPITSMSIKDIQIRTGRTRQVYEAIKALEQRGLLLRERSQGLELAWIWKTIYTLPEPIPVPIEEEVLVVSAAVSALDVAPKTKRRAKEPKPAKPASPQQHPAVLAYTEVTRRKPSNIIADQIVAQVTDVEKWQAAVKDYVMRGWNPLNVSGMIRLYNGEMKITTGRRSITLDIPHAPAADTQRAWERYLQENE